MKIWEIWWHYNGSQEWVSLVVKSKCKPTQESLYRYLLSIHDETKVPLRPEFIREFEVSRYKIPELQELG